MAVQVKDVIVESPDERLAQMAGHKMGLITTIFGCSFCCFLQFVITAVSY